MPYPMWIWTWRQEPVDMEASRLKEVIAQRREGRKAGDTLWDWRGAWRNSCINKAGKADGTELERQGLAESGEPLSGRRSDGMEVAL